MKRPITALAAALCLSPVAAFAQDADDWEFVEDPAQELTLAVVRYDGGQSIIAQCQRGRLVLLLTGLPEGGEMLRLAATRADGRAVAQRMDAGSRARDVPQRHAGARGALPARRRRLRRPLRQRGGDTCQRDVRPAGPVRQPGKGADRLRLGAGGRPGSPGRGRCLSRPSERSARAATLSGPPCAGARGQLRRP